MDLLRSLRHKLQLARRLSAGDWLVLAEAWWRLLGISLALRWKSYDSLEKSLRVTSNATVPAGEAVDLARRLAMMVGYASKLHLTTMTCLMRTLVLQRILGRRGVSGQVRIGATMAGKGLVAHAWLEVGGQAIGEAEDVADRFKVLSPV